MEKENKLGTMPISKLIINMSLPIIASMLVQALYNIVDSFFVAQISEQAMGQRRGYQRRIPGGGGLCHQRRAGAAVCGALLPVPDPN